VAVPDSRLARRNGPMRVIYQIIAVVVAAEVAIQAALLVWGDAGLGRYVDQVGVVDKSTFESAFEGGPMPFPEFVGLLLHGLNGMVIIPSLALLLLLASFFAKVPRGVVFALAVLGLVVLQATLGLGGHAIPFLGALHGINALVLFSTAMWTGLRVSRVRRTAQPEQVPEGAAV
jgi:NADH:ubiquinone oxidoreductase subunit K